MRFGGVGKASVLERFIKNLPRELSPACSAFMLRKPRIMRTTCYSAWF